MRGRAVGQQCHAMGRKSKRSGRARPTLCKPEVVCVKDCTSEEEVKKLFIDRVESLSLPDDWRSSLSLPKEVICCVESFSLNATAPYLSFSTLNSSGMLTPRHNASATLTFDLIDVAMQFNKANPHKLIFFVATEENVESMFYMGCLASLHHHAEACPHFDGSAHFLATGSFVPSIVVICNGTLVAFRASDVRSVSQVSCAMAALLQNTQCG